MALVSEPVLAHVFAPSNVWFHQGGPSGNDLHDVYYNQWDDSDNLPTDTHMWATPFDVGDPTGVEPWLSAVGGGIY